MPRRRAVTREQLEVLLALPATETELIRHWTLGAADLAAIERRRGDPNQLGFALQLCAFRYPGRLLHPREACSRSGPAYRAILPVLWRDPGRGAPA
jgi:TnpA family transposase